MTDISMKVKNMGKMHSELTLCFIYLDTCIFPSLQQSFILKDVEKDFDEETCQEYIHARQLGHLCSDDKEYMLLAKDKAFENHLNNKTTKITLYHACAASCKSYVTGTLLQIYIVSAGISVQWLHIYFIFKLYII